MDEMALWRLERAQGAVKRFAPDCPHFRAQQACIRVADSELSPTEFEVLVRQGCDPLVAVDLIKPVR